ncbi:protein KRI1 homolog [Ornithodoros turicata]|uniref:protein KRI1 homolog n=1 Tax=Ornithodoros turicata TaxID=34597 RepID=UPI003139CA54
MADLFGDESDSDAQNELKLNEDYAKKYNQWREKEELQKLKDKYGEDAILSSSSSEESEDEDAEELTSEVEKKFLETLNALKSKDPKIYSKDMVFFKDTPEAVAEATKKKREKEDKPMYIKDYERKIIVEKEGVLSDEDDDKAGRNYGTYATAAEEEQLKQSFKAALNSSGQENDDDDDNLLTTRQKSKREQEEKEEEYVRWLKGEVQRVGKDDDAQKLGYLHDYWNSGQLEQSEMFLRDFILNKRYLEKSEKAPALDEDDLSEDEATLEQQDNFEHKYNYRFEEPDQEFIKKYPRTLQDSMRRKNESRKVKRQEIRERKLKEKQQKREEINRLKALKRKEIKDKIEKLKEITGNDQLGFGDADIEADFNPEEYDRRMNDIFNSEYYSQECEEDKPEDPDDEDLQFEDWDDWEVEDEKEGSGSQEGGKASAKRPVTLNEAARRVGGDNYDDQGLQRHGKKWKKSHFAQTVLKRKPLFDPAEKSFEEYFDEYYKLDFEDIVGGMPTRFHYRKVTPNDFGLSVEEILSANDKELNRWCSVKRACQYRTEHEERQDVQNFRRRAKNVALKRKIFTSLCEQDEADDTAAPDTLAPSTTPSKESAAQKRKRRRMRQKNVTENMSTGDQKQAEPLVVLAVEEGKVRTTDEPKTAPNPVTKQTRMSEDVKQNGTGKKKRKRVSKKNSNVPVTGPVTKKNVAEVLRVSVNRLMAYGLNPKKVHKQMIYGGKKRQPDEEKPKAAPSTTAEAKKQKRRKKRKNVSARTSDQNQVGSTKAAVVEGANESKVGAAEKLKKQSDKNPNPRKKQKLTLQKSTTKTARNRN